MAKRRMNTVDALKLAIERERGASKFYVRAAGMTSDPDGDKMFKWLARQEARHLAGLRQQLKSVQESDRWLEWRRRADPLDRSEFPSASEASGAVTAGAGEKEALRSAIKAEQEAIAFYKEAEDTTPDLRGKSMFKRLAWEEEGHLALLEEELEWLTKSRKYFTVHQFDLRGKL
jgi:rubrerythrin